MTPMTGSTTTTVIAAGTLVAMATQRAPIVRPAAALPASLTACDFGFGRSRLPKIDSTAGSRVSAAQTATATPTAAATPITVRNGIWATASPQSAMITVVPANTTADPAVAEAWARDSSTPIPVGQLAAVPGDDEQAVVDADRQPDHQGQRGRGRGDRGDRRDGEDARHGDAHAERGGDQRQAGGEERGEGDGQDGEGEQDTEQLGDADAHAGAGVHVAAERHREVRPGRRCRRLLDLGDRLRWQVARGDVELDRDSALGLSGEIVPTASLANGSSTGDMLDLDDRLDLRLDRGLVVGDRS